MKDTALEVMMGKSRENSLSITFEKFRDKWELKLCKQEKTLEEIEEAEMILFDLEGIKEMEIIDVVHTARRT